MSKISELSDGGAIQSGDTLIAVRSGGNVKVTYGGTTTANIDGGTIDGTVIGGSSAAAGTFTSITGTSANINGTVTADGLTVSNSSLQVKLEEVDGTYNPRLITYFDSSGTHLQHTWSSGADSLFVELGGAEGAGVKAMRIQNGDISFYEDTGTTAKFFWDASAESLQLKSGSLLELERPDGAISSKIYMQAGASGGLAFDNLNGDGFEFKYAGVDQVVIDSTGNVGIGDSNPANGYLTIRGATTAGTKNGHIMLTGDSATNGQGPQIVFSESGASSNFAGASVGYVRTGSNGIGDLVFGTRQTAGDADTVPTEAMRIDSSGNLLVGTTSSQGKFTVEASGSVQGLINTNATAGSGDRYHAVFYESAVQKGSITSNGTATSYNITSDQRLKENITDAPAGNVDDIKVRSFDWKADGSHQDYGMVAQELEAVAPYAVTKGETEDDMWSVDYSKLVPMLIKEIQDLKAEVAALKGA